MSDVTDVFRDPARPVADRVADLVDHLTTEEKLGLLHQHQAAVPRLGVEAFRTGTEALHGVAWLGPATVFPQAVGLGASWNPELVRAVGSAVSQEVRAFHRKDPEAVGLNVWAPVVNPLRDPRWGRNEEGYSEDPWLTGELATAYGWGLAGPDPSGTLRTAPTLKHFLAYNHETNRCTTSSSLPARVLREYELPAFEAPLRAGAAVAVMPSYNLVNGRPAHLSPLINEVLRASADQELLVVSDAGAPVNLFELQACYDDGVAAYAAALRAGVDSFTQDDNRPARTVELLAEALGRGLITSEDVDRAVARVLSVRVRLGEFDPGEADAPAEIVGCPEHRQLAREAARQSMVLLKNDDRLLPVPAGVQRVAVFGPLADTLQQDWYSGTLPYQVTARSGLTERLAEVEYREGVDRVRFSADGLNLTSTSDGVVMLGSAYGGFDLFDWGGGACTLRSARTGRYVTVTGEGRLRADHPGPNSWVVNETFELAAADGGRYFLRHRATGSYVQAGPHGPAQLADRVAATEFTISTLVDGIAEAAVVAAQADVAIVVVGNHPLVNGRETEDRTELDLPAGQLRLVQAVHAANPRTVLVMSSSYPFSIEWAAETVPAVIWSAHGGQEYGHALADVLLGTADPAGRLPQTWYRSAADLPELLDYDIIASDATYQYFRGDPLYPFGHGLSYTTFAYSGLEISSPVTTAEGELLVRCRVTNTGSRAGHEVVQLYTHQQTSRVKQALRRLRAVRHLDLEPGETATVELTVRAAELGIWDVTRDRYCVEAARHSVLVGRSCTDIRLTGAVEIVGERIPPRDLRAASVPAALFDDYCGVVISDAALDHGDAVRSEHPGAWIAFEDTELGSALCVLTVASELSKPAVLELRLDDPYQGELLARAEIPPTGHRHAWVELPTALTPAAGRHALYVVFSEADLFLRELVFRPVR